MRGVNNVRRALLCGAVTAMTYVVGMMLGVAAGDVAFNALPGHLGEPVRSSLAALPAVSGLVLGSACWGVWMGRLAKHRETRRLAWAGILGLVPVTIACGVGLALLEPVATTGLGASVPIHRAFTLLFAPTAFAIAGVATLALGVGLRNRPLARRGWWRVALGAAVAFLVVDLVMDTLGWRVGAPGAAERFTMVTVLFVSALGAALTGGSMIGFALEAEGGPAAPKE